MTPVLLGVERSLSGARWVPAPAPAATVAALVRAHGLPEVVARVLAARDVEPGGVESFLRPTLRRDFPDPSALAGMDAAAEAAARAVADGRGIGLFGDFDVDGATSTALLARFFRALGVDAPVYIPDRMAEGYGPNPAALAKLRAGGADLVILADCGTTAFATMEAGKALGLTLIVLDHHEPDGARLPAADHVVNPKRADCPSGLTMLAAVGVALLFCVAVTRALRADGFFARTGRAEPPVRDWLDIVALGTVCDMVPLTGVNRLLVRAGLERMAVTTNPGLRALLEVARVDGAPTPRDLGFALGPRINAGGRIHESDMGARLLATDDAGQARDIAHALDDCNTKRRAMQAAMEREAAAQVEARGMADDPVIVVDDEAWHPGLAGLVAGRLRERYGRPACVVAYARRGEDGALEGRGSGRSSPGGLHIGRAFIAAQAAGILTKGGGHAAAGGFTVPAGGVGAFRAFLADYAAQHGAGADGPEDAVIDGVLSVRGASVDLVTLLHDHIGPFGQGAAEPVFALPAAQVWGADVVGTGGHVRVQLSDAEGGARMKAIAFRAADTDLGRALLAAGAARGALHIAGRLARNAWAGRVSAEMHITDAARA
jgi:single-stranded-DNA-specific exonuclease